MPAAASWLEYAQATQRIVCEKYAGETTLAQMDAAAEENVLVQIANLRTHPAVAAGIALEQIHVQGLVHRVETDELAAFDANRGRFVSIQRHANGYARASV
jgi:carbonic anhydrase